MTREDIRALARATPAERLTKGIAMVHAGLSDPGTVRMRLRRVFNKDEVAEILRRSR